MTIPEKAVQWAEKIAADDSHGYDQGARWGPDYDCSSSVIEAYERAGVPVKAHGASYTGNMRQAFLSCGFADVTQRVNLATGAGLQRGDVLLNEIHHTALYIGGGQLVNAGGNEFGGVTGGQTGDQTGREIRVIGYYNFPWDYVLRYEAPGEDPAASDPEPSSGGTYTVHTGDMLGLIALRFGTTIQELARLNNISDVNRIYPGQVLKLPGSSPEPAPAPAPAEDPEKARITALARDVIAGKYGNGLVRVLKLGTDYNAVQAEVNRLLAGNL